MLDVKTGHLIIDNKHKITPQSTFSTIEQWQLGTSQKTRRMGNGWNWVDVKNLHMADQYFNISFLFHGQRLSGFTFVFQDKPYEMNPGWASWSREAEQANLSRFNTWLDAHFGKSRKLSWGKVKAFYDSKSAASFIKLRYA